MEKKRFTFRIGGFIEVVAESAEAAQAIVTSRNHDAPRSFVISEGSVFVYAVPVGHPEEVVA